MSRETIPAYTVKIIKCDWYLAGMPWWKRLWHNARRWLGKGGGE